MKILNKFNNKLYKLAKKILYSKKQSKIKIYFKKKNYYNNKSLINK